MISKVVITKLVEKQLRKMPRQVVVKLAAWVDLVEVSGLEETRKISGFHNEPLRGKRTGQRSIRLSRAYRAIYVVKSDSKIEFISVEEVSNHDY